MSFAAVGAVVAFFLVGFYLLRWVQRKSTEIKLPTVAPGQWDPLVANYTSPFTVNPFTAQYDQLRNNIIAESAGGSTSSSSSSTSPPEVSITAQQRTALAQLLLRRAIHSVEQAMDAQEQKSTLQALMKAGSIGEDAWHLFNAGEEALGEELGEVAREAEMLKTGWGRGIFQQAQQIIVAERRKVAEEAERKAREGGEGSSSTVTTMAEPASTVSSPEEDERRAERMAAELIAEEEKRKKGSGGSSSSSGKGKKGK